MRSLGSAQIQYDWCPYKKRKEDAQREDDVKTQGECHVKMKAEIRVMHVQSERCQQTARNQERPETDPPSQPQKEQNPPTP